MKRVNYFIISILCLFLASCNDLEQYPIDRFTDGNYWTSYEKASAVLSQGYNQMYGSGYFFSTEMLSDNLWQKTGNEKTISAGLADAANGRFSGEWADCYRGIKTCNIFLENVDRAPIDPILKNRMKAEARFIRAFLFFRLANWYGDVLHFEKDPSLAETRVMSRKPYAEVVSWVRSELNAIKDDLPTKQQYAAADNGRITKGTVMTFLARTYLYENNWANVASTCEDIIGKKYGEYALFPSYEGLFLPENEYNSEVIFDIGYVLGVRTWGDYWDAIPNSVGGRVNGFSPTQELVDDYIMMNGKTIKADGSGYNENTPYINRDPRLDATIVYDGYKWKKPDGTLATITIKPGTGTSNDIYVSGNQTSSATGYYLRKWYDPTAPINNIAAGLNLILMRYADVLLMYAEAKNELGQMNKTVWDQTIRALRVRAGFVDPNALEFDASLNQSALRDVIRRERRCELAIEGTRIFDIRRWKTAEVVLNGKPHGARFANNNTSYIELEVRTFNKDRDYLWAVPQAERDKNPNLDQNPNYSK